MIYSRLLTYNSHIIIHTRTPDDDKLIVFQVNSKLWSSLFGHIKGPTGIQLYRENHSCTYIITYLYIMHAVAGGGCGGGVIVNRWDAAIYRGSAYYIYLRKVFEPKPLTVQAHRRWCMCVLIYIVFTSVAARIFYLIIRCARHCSSGDDERTGAISYGGITCALSLLEISTPPQSSWASPYIVLICQYGSI